VQVSGKSDLTRVAALKEAHGGPRDSSLADGKGGAQARRQVAVSPYMDTRQGGDVKFTSVLSARETSYLSVWYR
jgi:hypothetical protein